MEAQWEDSQLCWVSEEKELVLGTGLGEKLKNWQDLDRLWEREGFYLENTVGEGKGMETKKDVFMDTMYVSFLLGFW